MATVTHAPRQTRNIILIGKTGAGKSSVANAIVDHNLFEVSNSIDSCTRATRSDSGGESFKTDEYVYNIKLIDTVGVFHTGSHSNKETIESIKAYLQREMHDGINLILFVFKHGRFTHEEKVAFDYILENLSKDASKISALVVTCCEQQGKKARENIVKDIRDSDVTQCLAKFVEKDIFPVGFPNIQDIDEELRQLFEKKSAEDKKVLQDLVRSSESMEKSVIAESSWWRKITECKFL